MLLLNAGASWSHPHPAVSCVQTGPGDVMLFNCGLSVVEGIALDLAHLLLHFACFSHVLMIVAIRGLTVSKVGISKIVSG